MVNDANAEKRTLSASFSAINVADGVDLYLTQGNDEAIAVSASDEKYLERFKTKVEDGTLKIYYDSKGINWLGSEKRKLKAYVSFKTLDKLRASSGAGIHIKSTLNLTKLECTLKSGANFYGQVNIEQLVVSQSSGSEAELTGKTGNLKVEVSSGAIFKSYDLSVNVCEAKATSGAGVRITVNKELSAKANSVGGIHYKGTPVIKDLSVSSGGFVKKT